MVDRVNKTKSGDAHASKDEIADFHRRLLFDSAKQITLLERRLRAVEQLIVAKGLGQFLE